MVLSPARGKVKFIDWLGHLSTSEPIPLMGDIRTNQGEGLANHGPRVKLRTDEELLAVFRSAQV